MQKGNIGCYKKSMSCRKVVMRHLPIIVSDGMVNERKEIRRSRIKSGMTPNLMGFTLIELLVVVLIIGILAAVALPQYQKTVWKSRNAQLKQLIKSVAQAEQAYYMANGHYAANFDELSIDLPLTPVATTVGGYTGTCRTTTQGTDSARAGKDFYVALNSSDTDLSGLGVAAYYDTGKYTCAGFGIGLSIDVSPEQLHCREMITLNKYTAGTGEFCEKIEKGTRDTSFSNPAWRIYQLP